MSGIHNEIRGAAGHVAQVGTNYGGVHFHEQPRPRSIPRMLLPAPVDFTNRTRDLASLDALLAERTASAQRTVVLLTGRGRVGKTATGVHWLYRLLETHDNDRTCVLYADLNTLDGEPVSPDEVLSGWLAQLGVMASELPAGLAARSELFRTLVARFRVVALLDEAVSAAQVQPLLPPGADSVVVVTSRQRLSGLSLPSAGGARRIELEPFDLDAAVLLLATLIGPERVEAEPEQASALAELCGRLPVALCVAGARLRDRPNQSLARAVDQLTPAHRRLDLLAVDDEKLVAKVIDQSYRDLPADAARLYRALGLHPGPEFGLDLVAEIAPPSTMDPEELVDRLVRAYLVQEVGEQRYRFHDLIQPHARQQAHQRETAEHRDRDQLRMLSWYLFGAVAADHTVMPGRPRLNRLYDDPATLGFRFTDRAQALAWLETERPNLLAAVRAAAEREWDQLTWQLCEALWTLYFHHGHFPDWIASHQLGVLAARRCGDPVAEARMHCQLGFAYFQQWRFDQAAPHFAQSRRLADAAGHLRSQETAVQAQGLVALHRDRPAEAVELFTAGLELARSIPDDRAAALELHHLGRAQVSRGQVEDGLDTLRQAKQAMARLDPPDDYNVARVATSLGEAHVLAGLPADRAALADALNTMRHNKNTLQEAQVLEVLGAAAAQAGESELAGTYLASALAGYQGLGHPKAAAVQARLDQLSAGS